MGKHDAKQPKLHFEQKRSTRLGELEQGPQAAEGRDLTAEDQGEDLRTLMLEMRSSLRNIDTKLDNLTSQLDSVKAQVSTHETRFYRTPISLKRMGLRETDECWRCGSASASFLHIAWSCPRLKGYWSQVFVSVNQIVGRSDVPSPLLGLLGYVRDTPPTERRLHALLLLFAKRRVAIHLGRQRVPAVRDWLADVTYGHTQLTTFWELMPAAARPRDIWDPFVCWAREHQSRESEKDTLSE
ncbi:hypothetical protein NDU88_005160 [Pleurodeles waltl]|uniref:Reverse transcriptase n=1 Tax=Pleurodeles waltl TaxID=8319 RepID=A0AAV7SL04_PLEWA|nr:hypothetical protein NDU88_005160 [Pleurodeles waltl]